MRVDFLGYRNTGNLNYHVWKRYRAFMHIVEIDYPTGQVSRAAVALDRVYPKYEFIEEVRFQRYGLWPNGPSLYAYMEDFFQVAYKCPYNYTTQNIKDCLQEKGIEILPAGARIRVTDDPVHRPIWQKYYSSYEVGGFWQANTCYVWDSPYPEEIDDFSMYDIEFYDRNGKLAGKIKKKPQFWN